MCYQSIVNLYKCQDVISKFKQWYALEKIHGTSARIVIRKDKIQFVSGGAKHSEFVKCFDVKQLESVRDVFFATPIDIDGTSISSSGITEIIIYGEAYGGKLLKMAAT